MSEDELRERFEKHFLSQYGFSLNRVPRKSNDQYVWSTAENEWQSFKSGYELRRKEREK